MLTLITMIIAVLIGSTANVRAQSPAKETRGATGSISGRITIDGKAAPGVEVILQPSSPGPQHLLILKATTDEDGRFHLTGVAAGEYNVLPIAPAFVIPATVSWRPGKTVMLASGEAIEGIDLALIRGGVITGRVTDAEGQPLIGQQVALTMVDEQGRQRGSFTPPHWTALQIDDRGIYRVYGVPAGRYLVSVTPRSGRGHSQRTFHPAETDQTKAPIVEVAEGREVTGIDIKLGPAAKTHQISGQVIDAESGRPVPSIGVGYSYDASRSQSRSAGAGNLCCPLTDENGRFQISGLPPGPYILFAPPDSKSGYYSDPITFEVGNSDLTDLVLKARRGASISGTVVIDGVNDPALLAQRSQLHLFADEKVRAWPQMRANAVQVGAEGDFFIAGLRPGKIMLSVPIPQNLKGLSRLRIERDGVVQPDGLDVSPGEQVTGVRIVLAYGTGVVRGQVKLEGGTLPEGGCFAISAQSASDIPTPHFYSAHADARGRFVMEGMMPGEYTLSLWLSNCGATAVPQLPSVEQTVQVSNGAETSVTIVFDLRRKKEE